MSSTDQMSCPPSCVFRDKGCYAEFGKTRMHWEAVGNDRGIAWADFCAQIAALPAGQLWRHNEAGDLPGLGEGVDLAKLARLVRANAGKRGFTFTHKVLASAEERRAVKQANAAGFAINLSANGLAHADELLALGIAPVAVVLPEDAPDKLTTPGGAPVIVCLNETKGLTCEGCGLCAKADRKSIVGFRAHGQASAIVSDLVQLRRKVA